MKDAQLEKLSIAELMAFKSQVEDAIRAAIRAQKAQKLAEQEAALHKHRQPGTGVGGATRAPDNTRAANAESASRSDLERERDAWLARKK